MFGRLKKEAARRKFNAVFKEIATYYNAHKKELSDMEREGFLGEFYAIRSLNLKYSNLIAQARKNIRRNPISPVLIYIGDMTSKYELGVANSVPFHVDPYAPQNYFYSHVDVADGVNSLIERYLASYQLAKKHNLQALWLRSSPVQVLCLDGRLEKIEETLQKRLQPAMDKDTAMQTFLDAYAKDVGEEMFLVDRVYLYAHFNDEQIWAKPSRKVRLQEFLDLERVTRFINTTFGDYVCKDGSVLTLAAVRDYLRDIMLLENYVKQPPQVLTRQPSVLLIHPASRKPGLFSDIKSGSKARIHYRDMPDRKFNLA